MAVADVALVDQTTLKQLQPISRLAMTNLVAHGIDIYVRPDIASRPLLYCRDGACVKRTSTWYGDDVNDTALFYIRKADYTSACGHLRSSLNSAITDDSIPTATRLAFLQEVRALEVEQTLRHVDCERLVNLSHQMGREITRVLKESATLPMDVFHVVRHDFLTYCHITNVATYCVLLAQHLGIQDDATLLELATGGLLHDLGKRFIPQSILGKPGPLTDEERRLVEEHPQKGFEELCDRGDLSVGQLMMVYQHHERLDGSGYPTRIAGDEIHPWARLCAVVDVFDAMTGQRSYRRPATVAEALGFLERSAGKMLDEEMVRCWTAALRPN